MCIGGLMSGFVHLISYMPPAILKLDILITRTVLLIWIHLIYYTGMYRNWIYAVQINTYSHEIKEKRQPDGCLNPVVPLLTGLCQDGS